MDEESLSNLSFLNDSHVDAGELASDDKSGSDDGGATDEEDINVTLARALAQVTPDVKRVDTGATEFLQKPLDMCTATTQKVPLGQAEQSAVLVPPSPEKKHVEPVVSQHPSQQRQSLGCPSGAPAAAMEEQVRLVTSEGNKQVPSVPDKWSMQPAAPSSSAAAVASESENVAAAAMGAMVPRSPLQKHLPKLQIRTLAAFQEDFDEFLNMPGKKRIKLGEGAEGVVKAVLHRATGTLRAVKWCKRTALQSEVDLLHRMARTRGLGLLIWCIFSRVVLKHATTRGGRGVVGSGGEHPEIVWTFAFCLQPVRGWPVRERSADSGRFVYWTGLRHAHQIRRRAPRKESTP